MNWLKMKVRQTRSKQHIYTIIGFLLIFLSIGKYLPFGPFNTMVQITYQSFKITYSTDNPILEILVTFVFLGLGVYLVYQGVKKK